MSFLDLYQGDQEQAAKIQPNEGTRLPSTFNENFNAAWSDGRMFGQSIARANARAGVLNDYISEIRQKTGQDLSKEFIPDAAGGGQTGVTDFSTANDRVAKLKQDYPDLDLAPLSDEEIDNRAVAKAQAAHQTYEKLQAGEKTLGGSFGTGLGSLAAGVTDPINIVGLAVAPETAGVGILGAALRWGALAGVSQAAIEFSSDQFKEQVQPGYMESGGPGKEIAGAFLGGAATGGGIKALGNVWSRVKTGQWPTSVRDAGNVLESEANVANTNPFPGVEGEVAHREALVKTIDDILAGRPIQVDAIITPDFLERSRSLIGPSQLPALGQRERIPTGPKGQFEMELRPPPVARPPEAPLSPQLSGDPLRQQIKQQLPEVVARPSGEFDDFDLPIHHEGKNVGQIEFNVEGNRVKIQGGYIDSDVHGKGLGIAAYQRLADWALSTGRELHSDLGVSAQASRIYAALERRGYKIERDPDIEVNHLGASSAPGRPAFRVIAPPEEAQSIGKSMRGRERSRRREDEAPQPPLQTAKEMNDTLTAPDHQDAIRADIDREIADRATGSQNAPRATFTTAKGSVYSAFEDGTTTRNKAARPDVGHEGDSGIKDRSAKTIYVDGDASVLSGAGLTGNVGGKGYRVAIKDGKATFLWWNEKEGKWGAPESGRDIPFSTKPEVGKSPVELWKPATDVPGYEAYRGQHAGNKITSVVEHPKPPTEIMVPGVDENGNHTMVGVDAAMEQVDNYKKLAEQIQACVNPAQEAAE